MRNSRTNSGRKALPSHLAAGTAGGALAGALTAYGEALFILFTAGRFMIDAPFLLRIMVLYGLAGAAAGTACGLIFPVARFRTRPLRRLKPPAFYFALIFACGLTLEIAVYLLDIHTFRDVHGRWTTAAWAVLLLGLAAAGLAALAIAGMSRAWFHEEAPRKRNAGITLALLAAAFIAAWIVRGMHERAAAGPASDGGEAARPNVLILLVDSLRPDHLSFDGYALPTSPAADRLAREGVVFRNCYAASTWTVPTHASLFTGLYPSSHGSYSLYSSLDPAIPTIARILSGRGYRTGSLFANRLVGRRTGLANGFQTSLGVDSEDKVSPAMDRVWNRLMGRRSESEALLRIAGRWISHERNGARPFFLFMNFMDAHLPYRPREPYISRFLSTLPPGEVDRELAGPFTSRMIQPKSVREAMFARLTDADWSWLARFYDSNIRALDDRLGRFLEGLRSKGLLENTVVVFTADHGESLGETGVGGHNHESMSNAVLRIPLVFWFPGRLPAGEVLEPVSQVDIFPSILKLAGLEKEIPSRSQGTDLFARPARRHEVLAEYWDEGRGMFSRSIFQGGWKLMLHSSGERNLFDLNADPREENDLSGQEPGIADSLQSILDLRIQSMPQKTAPAKGRNKEETEKLLKSLGYL